jgi:hypothetical protein
MALVPDRSSRVEASTGSSSTTPACRAAVERRIELERGDANLLGRELIEDALRGQRLVILADAGVIAADDERSDAVVLADHGVEDRFARAGVAHRGGEGREDGAVARVVLLHQRLVCLEPHRRRHIVLLGFADQRMNDEAVAHFERELREVLVRAVNRVAGLEASHAAPAERADLRAQRPRREAVVQEWSVVAEWQDAHGAADELLRPPQQIGDAGVRGLVRAVDRARLYERVACEDVGDGDGAPETAVRVDEAALFTDGDLRRLVHRERDRQ